VLHLKKIGLNKCKKKKKKIKNKLKKKKKKKKKKLNINCNNKKLLNIPFKKLKSTYVIKKQYIL